MVTEEGSKGAESGMELVSHVGEIISELTHTIQVADDATRYIVSSTQQQSSGMDQLTAAVTQIQQASAQAMASIKQTEVQIKELTLMTDQLNKTAAGQVG